MISHVIGFVLMLVATLLAWVGLSRNNIYGRQSDKRKHLYISAIITIVIGSMVFITHNSIWYFIAAFVSFLIGVLKETADELLHMGTFEWGDLLADFVGSFVLGILTLFTIAVFLGMLNI